MVLFVLALCFSVHSALRGQAKWYDWLGPIGGAYLAVWYWLLIPMKLKKLYAQQKVFQQPIEVELLPEGISFAHAHGSGVMPWGHIHKWVESKDLFLVYHSDALYNVIPKRYFQPPASADEFRAALMQHAGPANNSFKPNPLRGSA